LFGQPPENGAKTPYLVTSALLAYLLFRTREKQRHTALARTMSDVSLKGKSASRFIRIAFDLRDSV
jgi:hypothetical protein